MSKEYILHLADNKNPSIKHLDCSSSLAEIRDKMNKRKVMPNQRMWIGEYVNGTLNKSVDAS